MSSGFSLFEYLRSHVDKQREMYATYVEYFEAKNGGTALLMSFEQWQKYFDLEEK